MQLFHHEDLKKICLEKDNICKWNGLHGLPVVHGRSLRYNVAFRNKPAPGHGEQNEGLVFLKERGDIGFLHLQILLPDNKPFPANIVRAYFPDPA